MTGSNPTITSYKQNRKSETAPSERDCSGGDEMNCPACESDNTQTVKMAVMSGTSSGKSTAIGINTSLDIGVAKITTNSQTKLVATLNPGPKPKNEDGAVLLKWGGMLLFVSSLLALRSASGGAEIVFILISIALLIVGILQKSNASNYTELLEKYNHRLKNYESGWICHKCGNTWVP